MDMTSRSERMLRAHLKNNAQEKNLEYIIASYNKTCRKKTNRVQQQILNIYYDELQPLQEAKLFSWRREKFDSKRRGLPRLKHEKTEKRHQAYFPKNKCQLFNSSNFSTSSPFMADGDNANTKLPNIRCRQKYSWKFFIEDCKFPRTLSDHWLKSVRKCALKHQTEDERFSVIGRALDL